MSRPTKATVDFFPHFTKHGKTMFVIERKFGNDGYACWFKTLEILGATENHFIDCRNPEDWEYLLATLNISNELAEEIFHCLSEVQAISKSLWKKRIIFSENLVKNLDHVYKRRTVESPSKDLVIEILGLKNGVSVDRNKVNDNTNPQSKVKYSKEKYIYVVFEHWNSKKIIVHREIEKFKSHISAKLNLYSLEEIQDAINNYHFILESNEHWFTYKWTLQEFLNRSNGFEKFLSENKPLENYKRHDRKREEEQLTPEEIESRRKLDEIRRRKSLDKKIEEQKAAN